MTTKFELTEKTVRLSDKIVLYRIKLLEDCRWGKKGDLGGFIEKKENISGNACISGNTCI